MKENEIEINEELVEEIRKEHCKSCLFLRSFDKGGMEYPEDRCGGNLELCRERIKRDILHILSAVRDGRQKILGEVGRGGLWTYNSLRYPQEDGSIAQYVDGHLYEGRSDFGHPRDLNFIALRQEEEK